VLKNKKIRICNYPSEITENLVKFAVYNKYKLMPCWDTKNGDLIFKDKKLEVKGSLNLFHGGPTSFGPTEKWYRLYFVDCKDTEQFNFIIYEIKLPSSSDVWQNIKVSKKQTFKEQCLERRRPRICYSKIIKQIPGKYISILFEGSIYDLSIK
jgi:hypothetical protein